MYTRDALNFKRTGYEFAGWNTQADGNGEDTYADGATFTMPDHDVYLYAKWTPKTTIYEARKRSLFPLIMLVKKQ